MRTNKPFMFLSLGIGEEGFCASIRGLWGIRFGALKFGPTSHYSVQSPNCKVCGDRLGYKLEVSAVTSKKIWVVLERRVRVRSLGFAITPEQSCSLPCLLFKKIRLCFFVFVFIFFQK